MQEGILNEPVRESAESLMQNFGDQMGMPFAHLMFIAVSEEGDFRTANYSKSGFPGLTVEAIRMVAKHLNDWADMYGEPE